MNIIFFSNPVFFADQVVNQFASMPRFTKVLANDMSKRGHNVEIWFPKARFFRFPFKNSIKKWLGYVDQYIIFPFEVRRRLKRCSNDTLFVFTDQAQGPWVPLTANRCHIIHCHDFLSQFSALGEIPENPTSITGKLYQYYIRKGLAKGRHFISVSYKTQSDLQRLLPRNNGLSKVIYNSLSNLYVPHDVSSARHKLGEKLGIELTSGYILHVGGNLWYKNRRGVIEIYHSWRKISNSALPLLMIGEPISHLLSQLLENSFYKSDVHFFNYLDDYYVRLAYAGASLFIFPSIAEGFGWPIAEAMACGCPVITTNEAPMTEVASNAGVFIPRRPTKEDQVEFWAENAAVVVNSVLTMNPQERLSMIQKGFLNVRRFDSTKVANEIEKIYKIVNKI